MTQSNRSHSWGVLSPHPEQATPSSLVTSPKLSLPLLWTWHVVFHWSPWLSIRGDNWPCPSCLLHPSIIMKRGDAEGHSSSPLQRGKLRPLERLWIPDFLGFWTLLFAPNMAYTNSPPPLQGFSGQIPGLPLLWQQQLTRPLLWGFPQGPCPERRQKGLPPRGTRESGEK